MVLRLQGLFKFTQVFNGRSRAVSTPTDYQFTTFLTNPVSGVFSSLVNLLSAFFWPKSTMAKHP